MLPFSTRGREVSWRGRQAGGAKATSRENGRRAPGGARRNARSALDDGEDVAGGEDEELLAAVLDLGAAVLAVDDLVADLDVERHALAVVVDAARADGEDLALLGLLLRGVR